MKMRKVIGRTAAVVAFVLLFAAGYIKLNRVLVSKVGFSDTINTFYDHKKDDCDVLFVGTSHAYRGFSPMELWNDAGITSFTLASPSQPMAASLYLIKEGIRMQHPKLIVLEMYGFRYNGDFREENLHMVIDPIPLGKTKLLMAQEYLSDRVDFSEMLTYLFPLLRYHQRWDSLNELDYVSFEPYMKGYQYTTVCFPQEKLKRVKGKKPIDEEILSCFDQIVEECEKSGTDLLLVGVPLAKEKKNKASIKRFRSAAQYAARKGIPSLIMNDFQDEIGVDAETDFYNSTHLNYYGGKKVTAYMAKYLQENYELEDHRGDSNYDDWQRCYEEYVNFQGTRPDKWLIERGITPNV